MLERFYPTIYVENVSVIDYDDLLKRGKIGLLFDLDNTLAPFDIVYPTDDIISFISSLLERGFKVCLVSNNKGTRVEVFNEKLNLPMVSKAGKPKKKGISKALSLLNVTPQQAVMIGDQLFTDVYVGNRLNMETILVKPISDRDEFTVKLKRGIEKIVFNKYMKSERAKQQNIKGTNNESVNKESEVIDEESSSNES